GVRRKRKPVLPDDAGEAEAVARRPGEAVLRPGLPEQVRCGLGVFTKTPLALAQGLLRLLVLGDIAQIDDNGPHARLIQQVSGCCVDPAPGTAPVPDETLAADHSSWHPQRLVELPSGVLLLIGMDEVEGVAADVILGGVAEHPCERGACVNDRA